jgi:hypothetical protein
VLGNIRHASVLGTGHHASERRKLARDFILISYAGIPAQRLVDSNVDPLHGGMDEEQAFETSRQFNVLPRKMSYIGDEQHHKYLDRLRREAIALVKRNEPAIRHLASILLERVTMTGKEVERALADFELVT